MINNKEEGWTGEVGHFNQEIEEPILEKYLFEFFQNNIILKTDFSSSALKKNCKENGTRVIILFSIPHSKDELGFFISIKNSLIKKFIIIKITLNKKITLINGIQEVLILKPEWR